MDDIISTSGELDPVTFLQVEMGTHQELGSGSGTAFYPGASKFEEEYHGLAPPSNEMPGAEASPFEVNSNHSDLTGIFVLSNGCNSINKLSAHSTQSMQEVVEVRRHICSVCLYRFKRMDHLKRHMMTHTLDEVLEAQANLASTNSESGTGIFSSLRGDVTLANDVRRYTCNVCFYSFKRGDHLKRHMARSHPEELALLAATAELEKARRTTKLAKNNSIGDNPQKSTRSGGDERKYVCTLCDFRFKRRDHLSRHMTVHCDHLLLPNKRNSKNIVVKTEKNDLDNFSTKEKVLKTRKRDKDERPFVCNVCDYRFKRRFHLMRHMTRHNEDRLDNRGRLT